MSKALEFQPIVQRREFYQIEGIETKNDCAVLSQLVYWANVSGFNEFYKTDEELSEETRVSVSSIERIKRKLKSLSFVIITRKGVPAKTYYKIDPHKILEETPSPYVEQCLLKLINNNTETAENSAPSKCGNKIPQNEGTRSVKMRELDPSKCGNKIPQNEGTIYRTETTSKTTTENTTKIKENTAIAQIEHEHEHEFSDAEFENKETTLSLSDESCVLFECKNDLTQSEPEQEEDQDALKAHEIISTPQHEILTDRRQSKGGHRIPQSKSIATRSRTEHDEPVAYDKPYVPQSNIKASRSRKNHDEEPASHDEFHIPQSNLIPQSRTQARESVLPDYILQSNTLISPKALAQNDEFEEWWSTYNHKVDKKIALKGYIKATRRIKASELLKRTQNYLRLREALKKGDKFVPTLKNPATWLNNDCWDAEELRDTSTPQEKHQTALDEIRAKYRGQEARVREQLFKNLGNDYLFFLKDAEIFFDHKAARVLVRNSIVQDELCGRPSSQVKNAFKHIDAEHLIIKNIEQDSPDVSLMI